jgi:hypothetical protein
MPKIHESICNIMNEVSAIGKARKNVAQGYQFRGIDDVYNEIHDILAKNKVFTVPTVLTETHEERPTKSGGLSIYRILKIKYTFYSDDGSNLDAVVIGEGMDSGDKASNKAQAVAHKYALLQVFCIPTDDLKDPENDSHEPLPLVPTKPTCSEEVLKKVNNISKDGCKGKDCIKKYLGEFNTAKKTEYKLSDLNTDERLTAIVDFINSIPPKI